MTGTTPDPQRWKALAFIGIAQLMVVLDATIVNIALPRMQADLGFSDTDRSWVVTAYTLAFGGLLLLGGRLGDIWGRKRVFLIGLIGFAAASALGGAAVGTGMLFGARALQGVFGALLAPAALSLVALTFTEAKERATAFGLFSAVAMAGSAIGLLLGGALTEYVDWRWCLYVNIVFALAAAAGAARFVHDTGARHRARLDVPGTVLGTGGLGALVHGFAQAEEHGWAATTTLSMFVASAVLLVAFVVLQSRTSAPLLPLRVVTDRNRGGVYLGIGLAMIANFAQFLFLAYYLQLVKGYSPMLTGLAFMPMTIALTIGSTQLGARLMTRLPPRALIVPGLLATAAAMVLLAQLEVDSSYWALVLPAQLILGLGLGTAFTPAMSLATHGVDPRDAGVASAMLNTSQQIGGSIGTALLNTIAAGATAAFAHTTGDPARVAAEAAVHGYTTAFWWAAAMLVLAAVIVVVSVDARHQAPTQRRPSRPPRSSPTDTGSHPPNRPAPPPSRRLHRRPTPGSRPHQ